MTIAPGAADDEFTTTVKLQPVGGGPAISRTGTSIVYAGYSWRGRSKGSAVPANAAPDDLSSEMREAMWISPDQTWGEGRWFWGEYQEFGIDVKIQRATSEPSCSPPTVFAQDRFKSAACPPDRKQFPAAGDGSRFGFRRWCQSHGIVSHTATQIVADVDVAADAVPGKRDVAVGRASLQGAIAVYDKVDYIKVLPETALARLGGDAKSVHPKGYQQLEAIAFSREKMASSTPEMTSNSVPWM